MVAANPYLRLSYRDPHPMVLSRRVTSLLDYRPPLTAEDLRSTPGSTSSWRHFTGNGTARGRSCAGSCSATRLWDHRYPSFRTGYLRPRCAARADCGG